MALNPPLIPGSCLPLPVNGETFVLQRTGMQLEVDIMGVRKYQHKGCLYLSTLRMVFVKDRHTTTGWFGMGGEAASDLMAYDLPLSLVRNEKFNQPIFGCNNVEGVCLPLPGTSANTHFRLSFYEGGVGTFLPLFFDLLNRNRVGPAEAPPGLVDSAYSSGSFMQSAYIDPNDPTTLFVPSNQPVQLQHNSVTREEYYRHGPHGDSGSRGVYSSLPPSSGASSSSSEPRRAVVIPTSGSPRAYVPPGGSMQSQPSASSSTPAPSTPAIPEGWSVVK